MPPFPDPSKNVRDKKARGKAAYLKGHQGETLAHDYLLSCGYGFLEKRWKCPHGEIDLIMKDQETLVFIEVKVRKTSSQVAYALTPLQQSRLHASALFYLSVGELPLDTPVRFDVILITDHDPLTHIHNAF
jgi:putative endonuclease